MRKLLLFILLFLVWLIPMAEAGGCFSNRTITTGFKTSQWYSQVRTGDFDLGEFITGGIKKTTHHDNMNMDNEWTDVGQQKPCESCKTYYEIAFDIALRHTAKILKNE